MAAPRRVVGDAVGNAKVVSPETIDAAEEPFDLLAWDSNAFGFGVARIRDTVRSAESLSDAVRTLRARGVRLAYFACPWDDLATRTIVAAQGGKLVDRKVTYAAHCADIVTGAAPPDVATLRYTGTQPDDALIRLARQSGKYSRFRIDPAVETSVFEHIYDAWIRKSVSGEIAEAVYVASVEDAAVGLVTVAERSGRGDIGLLAVDDRARRRGVGRALVGAARDWTVARGLTAAQVVTQGENGAACALYEACGYRPERIVAVYHCWV